MAHPGVFQPVVTGLEALGTPAGMGQELFQSSKAVDILNFGDEGSQRRDVTYREVSRLIRPVCHRQATCGRGQLSPSPPSQ